MRRKPGPHLTTQGIALANRVGAEMGKFDRVFTSDLPRAFETAVAFGCEITASRQELGAIPTEIAEKVR